MLRLGLGFQEDSVPFFPLRNKVIKQSRILGHQNEEEKKEEEKNTQVLSRLYTYNVKNLDFSFRLI